MRLIDAYNLSIHNIHNNPRKEWFPTLSFLRGVIPLSFSTLLYDIHNSSNVSPTASCEGDDDETKKINKKEKNENKEINVKK